MDKEKSKKVLTQTVQALENVADKKNNVDVSDVVTAINSRGLCAMLIPPALLALSPIGAIPGIPAFCGALIAIVSLQIIMNRSCLWVPPALKKYKLRHEKMHVILSHIKPYTMRIDRVIKPRLSFLCHGYLKRIIGLICLIIALCMIAIGFIPFMPAILAVPILVFSLGIIAKDGIIILSGFFLTAVACVMFFWLSATAAAALLL